MLIKKGIENSFYVTYIFNKKELVLIPQTTLYYLFKRRSMN